MRMRDDSRVALMAKAGECSKYKSVENRLKFFYHNL